MRTNSRIMHATSAAWLAGLLLVGVAWGQDALVLAELKQWHAKFDKANEILSPADGEAARAQLKAWNLSPEKLDAEPRGWLLQVTIRAALAVGDVRTALEWLPRLQAEAPEDRGTLRAAWLVAIAAGDGQLAAQTLEALRSKGLAGEKAIALRQRRLALVGKPAPDESVDTADGQTIALQRRGGVVLVMGFWRLKPTPEEKHVKALRELYGAWADDSHVQFVGINADPPAEAEAARKQAAEWGHKWPQVYGLPEGEMPLTRKLADVDAAPYQIVIDGEGNTRAAGAASEPELVYALRAAVAEAKGAYAVMRPKTTAGEAVSEPVAAKPAGTESAKADATPQATGKSDLPHNQEAARLLNEARVFQKTGRKTDARRVLQEIIDKYPGTWEAAEAKERLESL